MSYRIVAWRRPTRYRRITWYLRSYWQCRYYFYVAICFNHTAWFEQFTKPEILFFVTSKPLVTPSVSLMSIEAAIRPCMPNTAPFVLFSKPLPNMQLIWSLFSFYHMPLGPLRKSCDFDLVFGSINGSMVASDQYNGL